MVARSRKVRASQGVIFVFCLSLFLGGAWVAAQEARSYFSSGITQAERFAALADGTEVLSLSTASRRLVLDNCLDGVVAVYARTRPTDRRDSVAEECRRVADDITVRAPTYSYAWYVGAVAASRLKDTQGVIDRLRKSQIVGPNEQWIAELRVGLAETYLDQLPDDVRAQHDSDLKMLAQSSRGVTSIAARYVRDASFRERITAIVEQLPQRAQQRFLENVRTAATYLGA